MSATNRLPLRSGCAGWLRLPSILSAPTVTGVAAHRWRRPLVAVVLLLAACGKTSGPSLEDGAESGGASPTSSGGSGAGGEPAAGGNLGDGGEQGDGGKPDQGSGGDLPSSGSPGAGGEPSENGSGGSGAGAGSEPATGGAEMGGTAGCSGDVCALAPHAAPTWITEITSSGKGPAFIRFDEGGELVRVGLGETEYHPMPITTLERRSGTIKGAPSEEPGVIARDRSGDRLVVRGTGEGILLIDGIETLRFGQEVPDTTRSAKVSFSPDGSALVHISCTSVPDQLIGLDVYDTASGTLIASAEANLPCFYSELTTLVDPERRRILFGHPASGDLFVMDWDTETITSKTIHQKAAVSPTDPRNNEGTILNLALSPDAETMISIGALDGLAVLDLASLEVEGRLKEVPYANLYDACFCEYHSESPIAWSPSGDIMATAALGGGIALYDAHTLELLEELFPPDEEDFPRLKRVSTDVGPVLFEFAPDMRQLVALYSEHAVGYSLRDD